jgi:hypothetical protein
MFKVLSKIKSRFQSITPDPKERVESPESHQEEKIKKERTQRKTVTNQLEIILEVMECVRRDGLTRTKAIQVVAEKRGIARATVNDKCCRLLNLNAETFDKMLNSPTMEDLRQLLINKWEAHRDMITNHIDNLVMLSNKKSVENPGETPGINAVQHNADNIDKS